MAALPASEERATLARIATKGDARRLSPRSSSDDSDTSKISASPPRHLLRGNGATSRDSWLNWAPSLAQIPRAVDPMRGFLRRGGVQLRLYRVTQSRGFRSPTAVTARPESGNDFATQAGSSIVSPSRMPRPANGEGHGDAVVVVGLDRAGVHRAGHDFEAVGALLGLRARGARSRSRGLEGGSIP
jgi:hypothetical protein